MEALVEWDLYEGMICTYSISRFVCFCFFCFGGWGMFAVYLENFIICQIKYSPVGRA